jgi:RNA polymerase sigma factor (sigma-70 family)
MAAEGQAMVGSPEFPPGQAFTTTHWSEIAAARTASPERRRLVLDDLAQRYWGPVYHFLRAHGRSDGDARDLTQEFFLEVVLGRDLFGRADPARGRFRTYMLHCLRTFLRERYRQEHAAVRSPVRPLFSLEERDARGQAGQEPAAPEALPEQAFHRQWAVALLERTIGRLSEACRAAGLEEHFAVFEEHFLRPTLERGAAVPLETLAERFSLSPKQAANHCETVRRRFRKLLLEEIRVTVDDQADVQDELRALMDGLQR